LICLREYRVADVCKKSLQNNIAHELCLQNAIHSELKFAYGEFEFLHDLPTQKMLAGRSGKTNGIVIEARMLAGRS
jgi:hypothetical protein